MQYKTKLTLKIFWQHVSKYKAAVFSLFTLVLVGSAANMSAPYLYKLFFDELAGSLPIELKIARMKLIIVWVLVIYMFDWVIWRAAAFVNSWLQTRMMADLANTCFNYLHKHSVAFFEDNFVGSLAKRINRFYKTFEIIADNITWQLIPLVTEIALVILVLGYRNIYLGISILAWSVLYCCFNYLFSKYKLKYDVQRSAQDTRVTGVLADTITNETNIKLFSAFQREAKNFANETDRLRYLRRFTWDLAAIFEGIQILLMIFLEFGVFMIATDLWQKHIITVGDFVLIQAYLLKVFQRIWDFGKIIRDYYEAMADAEEMTEILDTPHEIVDVKKAAALKVAHGEINFNNVSFYYHHTRPIMEHLNMNIKPGERVAFVGPSGAGKSTLVKLLLRVADTTGGKVEIDGQNIKKVTQDSLHREISLVPQNPMLFHRTLFENIRYGKPDATLEQVIEAAKLAHCHEFIADFPDQYETYVGERGVKLSGGERQRVAIARAILKNSPILVLDEATSSLDSESESFIQDALQTLMKGKTVIVIAHRLSTIMKMDRILVIDNGKIIEEGSHAELVKKKGGLYHKLWKYQAGGFIE